jgi:multidrug efflux pump subunit AcrB
MWIVRIALKRPLTFIVLAILIFGIGPLTIARTPTDIFPDINIPVVAVIWNYGGLSADEMSNRISSIFERLLTTAVNDVEHVEAQSLRGTAVVKVFFQPGAKIDLAVAQVTAATQAIMRQLPPGITPPFVLNYNASTVPVLQLALSGKQLSEQQLFDLAVNFLRPQLASINGAQIPYPYGGKQPQIQVDLDAAALQAKRLSPSDVVNAISLQNLLLPTGTQKIGSYEYDVDINASTKRAEELNDLPIRMMNGSPIHIRDVAHVREGFPPQTNIVRVDGQRSVLLSLQKVGSASTLDIISRAKSILPQVQAGLPPQLVIRPVSDQSVFVRASINGVLRETLIAASLTAIMILVFLGSWRSTLIIAVSIPLSILSSIIALSALGETINVMTLGGLALAVGVLVDDATVTIENINTHLEAGKALEPAILEGADQIALPALVSTICICIVFVPMFFLTGVARYLFVPMAEAVVFAMLASYVLSRTLVPTLANYWLRAHTPDEHHETRRPNLFERVQRWIDGGFLALRDGYRQALSRVVAHRRLFVSVFLAGCAASLILARWVGEDFFPAVDGGQFKLHLRAPSGTRIEETAALSDRVEDELRRLIPPRELASIIDNIGLPYSGINLSYSTSAPIGAGDADILVALNPGHHPTEAYIHDLRTRLPKAFPGTLFSFVPSDIVTQILNFGLPAPIDIQIVGRDLQANRRVANGLIARLAHVPGITDLRVHQTFNQPGLHLDVDRTRAEELGITQRDVATNLLIALSGSSQTTPSFWLNPATGVSYPVATQMPQYRVDSLQSLGNIPVATSDGAHQQVLEGLASVSRDVNMSVVSHFDTQPVLDIFGSVQRRDLGGVSADLQPILDAARKSLPRGSQITVRGQIETMTTSFQGLLAGLALAIVLVYLLIVVNFQSWLDPFIIVSALPAALAGIVWFLFLSHTTFNVPSLTGAIMCMGVATANSILVVSFAKDALARGQNSAAAAIDAGFTRFRPVLMTALAMMIGMVPMALGLGEGGEQNAPLGRAVIGGLALATVATLFFVPCVFAWLHGTRTHTADVTH